MQNPPKNRDKLDPSREEKEIEAFTVSLSLWWQSNNDKFFVPFSVTVNSPNFHYVSKEKKVSQRKSKFPLFSF